MTAGAVTFTVAGPGGPASGSASYTVGPVVNTLPEFGTNAAQPGVALWQKTGPLIAGTDPTAVVYQQTPMSSTKTNVSTGTTPWFLMMFGNGSSSLIPADIEVAGFTLQGQTQPNGLWFHGLRIGYSTGAKVHDLIIKGSIGAGSSPPQETFALPFFHADNFTISDVVIDGRNTAGASVSGSLLGYNYVSGNTTANRVKANYTTLGFGAALFGQAGGTHTFNDCDFSNNRKAVNIEGNSGGTFVFNRCDFRNLQYPYQMDGLSGTGPVQIKVVDPLWNGTTKFTVYVGPNQAVKPTIQLIQGGVDTTATNLATVSTG